MRTYKHLIGGITLYTYTCITFIHERRCGNVQVSPHCINPLGMGLSGTGKYMEFELFVEKSGHD
jgi:hypothetical protein